jgi:hypothetical protein
MIAAVAALAAVVCRAVEGAQADDVRSRPRGGDGCRSAALELALLTLLVGAIVVGLQTVGVVLVSALVVARLRRHASGATSAAVVALPRCSVR